MAKNNQIKYYALLLVALLLVSLTAEGIDIPGTNAAVPGTPNVPSYVPSWLVEAYMKYMVSSMTPSVPSAPSAPSGE